MYKSLFCIISIGKFFRIQFIIFLQPWTVKIHAPGGRNPVFEEKENPNIKLAPAVPNTPNIFLSILFQLLKTRITGTANNISCPKI